MPATSFDTVYGQCSQRELFSEQVPPIATSAEQVTTYCNRPRTCSSSLSRHSSGRGALSRALWRLRIYNKSMKSSI